MTIIVHDSKQDSTTPRRGPEAARPLRRADLSEYASFFWSRVRKGGAEDCWPHLNSPNQSGYTSVRWRGLGPMPVLAHRVAYVLGKGDLPAGMTVDHLCCVPRCVNPAHLEAVTQDENNRRKLVRNPPVRSAFCYLGHPKRETTTGRTYCPTCQVETNRRNYKPRRPTTEAVPSGVGSTSGDLTHHSKHREEG